MHTTEGNKLGIELHAVIEFSALTKVEASGLVRVLNLRKLVADAQLHGKSFDNPEHESLERKGELRTSRRACVFVVGETEKEARERLEKAYGFLNGVYSNYQVVETYGPNGKVAS